MPRIFASLTHEEARKLFESFFVRVVNVTEARRWRVVRSRDYFSDIPAMAAHYEQIQLPR